MEFPEKKDPYNHEGNVAAHRQRASGHLDSFRDPEGAGTTAGLAEKGIEKFIAYEIPIELAKQRYGAHFSAVANDVHETDRLRILDFNGQRAFSLFHFDELGTPTRYEAR